MIYSERSSCQGQVCLQLCCSVVVELREQNYSHREGVEKQRAKKDLFPLFSISLEVDIL